MGGNGPNYEIGMYSNDNNIFRIKDNGTAQQEVTFNFTPNQWYFISCGQSNTVGAVPGNLRLYHSTDAGSWNVQSSSSSATSGDPGPLLKLFSNQTGGQNLNAHCGEIRIYNRELSTPEFLENFNATRGRYGV
tara:strand:+ start:22 stop:420 length:399 start_codon:yes stop_codon:yes gene_type:complete